MACGGKLRLFQRSVCRWLSLQHTLGAWGANNSNTGSPGYRIEVLGAKGCEHCVPDPNGDINLKRKALNGVVE